MILARRWKSGCLIANINADEKYRHIKKIHIFHFFTLGCLLCFFSGGFSGGFLRIFFFFLI